MTARRVLCKLWGLAVGLAIGMMLCGGLMVAGWLVYRLAFILWGPE